MKKKMIIEFEPKDGSYPKWVGVFAHISQPTVNNGTSLGWCLEFPKTSKSPSSFPRRVSEGFIRVSEKSTR